MTHAELVHLAARWLASRCPVVITEMSSAAWEEPDAIGWRGAGSILVECKVSRADLRADRDKPYRRREMADGVRWPGLGDERYYLMPAGLVEVDDPLLLPGWGVLFANPAGKVRVARKAEKRRQGDQWREILLLVSCIRRLGIETTGGTSVKVYTTKTKCRAAVHIDGGDDLVVQPLDGATP